jgi:hypothetical protein
LEKKMFEEELGGLGLIKAGDKDNFERLDPKSMGPCKTAAALEKPYQKNIKK